MSLSPEQRAEISRRNGAKSRGPVTEEGKRRSRQNAVRHGLLARTILLRDESESRFNLLSEKLRAEFQPVGAVECSLVETMIAARWRQMRLWSLEQANVQRALDCAAAPFDGIHAAVPVSDAYRYLHIETLSRQEHRLDRQYERSLRTLQQHRQWRERTRSKEMN